ncbi:uncharacterized protein [Temnothorax nylanderi]|uniref:uncharacterized protein n=1 Tax=Temnothorax nylanderi TaxID=102681 RepID=UPI003A861BCC
MGKIITRRSTDDEETAKLRRKRRKKDLDRIHFKILQARQKLDNVVKGNKDGQKRQGRAKICNRLLPEPAAGIYRNGAKGKDIQRAETLENTFHKARLKADALKLFNGDTHGSKRIVEIPTRDKTTEQSPNKDCTENSLEWTLCTLEQSPVLGKRPRQNQKLCLIKKKGEENIFENADYNRMKQNVNDESRHGQKEDVCKRRLFQNDREQLETATPTIQIFDNIDLTKENKSNENEAEPTCSKNSKDLSPLSCYKKFSKMSSAKHFEKDVLPIYHLDPVEKTIKTLRYRYADSFRQQLLRKKNKQELENVEPTYSVEYQACTSSNISQFSPVEFEVPKCSKNYTTAVRLQEGSSSQKNSNLMQNTELEKGDGIRRYNSTSCSSRNTFITYDANGLVRENCENNNTQRKSKRHDKVNFLIDIPGYSRCVDNSKLLAASTFLRDSVTTKRLSSKDFREKLPIAICDNSAPNNVSQKCNNRTANMCNVKNVKRIPTILRRYSNITNNKLDHSVQITGDYVEGLHKKCETNLLNRNPSNSIENELYETISPSVLKNLLTSSTTNAIFDQTKILEPQIGSMKIKDSQESQVEQFDIIMYPKEHNERNGFYRHDGSFYPRTLETSRNTNVYSEKLPQQEQISPDIRKHCFHSNNYRPTNYLQGASSSNSNIESTKEFPQRTKLHVYESNKQPFFRENTRNQTRNIIFNNVNDRAIPTPILNLSQDIQTEKRSTCRNMFDKTDIERAKNQVNQNACHCSEQYVYFDSANRPRKEQAHYCKETTQPESLCDTRGYNNNIDNYVNLSSTMRNVPLVSLKQNNNLHAVPKAIDNQHRAMLLQNVTQPVKYLAVKSGSDMQRIPVYINDRSVKVAENIPLKVIAVMDPSAQTKAFPQEIVTQVIPLQTDSLQFSDFATREISDQSFVKRLDSVNAILFNPDSQSNIWYASNL